MRPALAVRAWRLAMRPALAVRAGVLAVRLTVRAGPAVGVRVLAVLAWMARLAGVT
ncbi:hypothetical protein [Nonomuraea candida]|uniref:hypothetical protein n=1 Tax=Nonomuraea candida TaxID=359159 RepID=UPI0012FAF441|nr:hypothetical protein [Nonomuraea candida]